MPMKNPLLSKNPFMSSWLSAANTVMRSAAGTARSAATRSARAAIRQAGQQAIDFWAPAMTGGLHSPVRSGAKRKKR